LRVKAIRSRSKTAKPNKPIEVQVVGFTVLKTEAKFLFIVSGNKKVAIST
jgi:hypothetical protein